MEGTSQKENTNITDMIIKAGQAEAELDTALKE
jgi:hypothetical protein